MSALSEEEDLGFRVRFCRLPIAIVVILWKALSDGWLLGKRLRQHRMSRIRRICDGLPLLMCVGASASASKPLPRRRRETHP